MRGIWHFQQFARDENREAETLLRRAVELDAKLALAHTYLARTLNSRIWWGWSKDIDKDIEDELTAATRAVELDERDPYAHYALSLATMLALRHEQSLAAAQRAIDLTPNFALGYFALGWIRIYIGRSAEALDPMLRSLRLNPNDRQSETFLGQAAIAQYHIANFEECCRLLPPRSACSSPSLHSAHSACCSRPTWPARRSRRGYLGARRNQATPGGTSLGGHNAVLGPR